MKPQRLPLVFRGRCHVVAVLFDRQLEFLEQRVRLGLAAGADLFPGGDFHDIVSRGRDADFAALGLEAERAAGLNRKGLFDHPLNFGVSGAEKRRQQSDGDEETGAGFHGQGGQEPAVAAQSYSDFFAATLWVDWGTTITGHVARRSTPCVVLPTSKSKNAVWPCEPITM